MELEKFWAEIEADQTWRIDELRFFQNRLEEVEVEDERERFRRALVLLLYAHFEGFCKFSLLLYINAVNEAGIRCDTANTAIVAASLHSVFRELRDPSTKCDLFVHKLPDDAKLHRFARDLEFIENVKEFNAKIVVIPESVVDTQSNLKPVVLRKNLFQLGFKYDQFEDIEGDISKLLNFRNKIAHGSSREGIRSDTYQDLWLSTTRIMNTVKSDVMAALQEKRYLRAA